MPSRILLSNASAIELGEPLPALHYEVVRAITLTFASGACADRSI